MLGFLKGKVINSQAGKIIVDTGGVGYRVSVLPIKNYQIEKEYELFIHHHIREDLSDLYGFDTSRELEMFENLITANGVGPKAAMNILSNGNPEKISEAIATEDINFFKSISGIGSKVSAKIIVELKSKVSNEAIIGAFSSKDEFDEVSEALMSLGFKKSDISILAKSMPKDLKSNEDKVKWFLKNSSK
ncbi:Holliday junction DNA helicase RuvA [Candidatus Berkelbacteria bacterium RIFOXYA2_FULL_43_10]|uniref:Holliday junction branch migration complex subunit RuvA n=1 Tax=Candidatus Berkelbacteria bacterium RIFOXYA2_FULL_43_10 TaxID=1797472 RepID=A0A1F5EB13_9BACT|nr:MAG: Holliday junction DNA helicase RuvA [Candidatus Berkelbacteria bacterium RIFOXYA2_FULL_43_10]